MTTWLSLAVLGQFLFAVSILIDRHIVVRAQHIGNPIVYAFYISVLSSFVIVLVPFGFVALPTGTVLLWSFLYAATFISAIFFLYSALKIARASDAAPVIGAISAISTLVLAGIWIEGDIRLVFVPSVLLLIAGTALISHFHFTRRALLYTFISGTMFGATVFFTKLVFLDTQFWNGFFWTRMLAVIVALALLLLPVIRSAVFKGGKRSSSGAKALVVSNKMLGGAAAIVTALAINLGSASIVNALAGLQFVFLFLFAYLFATYMPKLRDGRTHGHGGWQTGAGVSLIVIGFALLYLGHSLGI